jgi:polyphosphate kinase 2 PPK2
MRTVSVIFSQPTGCWPRPSEPLGRAAEKRQSPFDANIRIAKIFLHISPGEQIRRFKDRVNNPLKRSSPFLQF